EVTHGGDTRWILDPLNPHRAHDPFGANSVCHSDGYVFPEWAQEDPDARPGAVESLRFHSTTFHDERTIRVYLPARFRRRARYPLLVAHDGDDYLRFSGMKAVLDNLIHRLEIPPMIVALTNPVDRLTEYAASERHATFLVDELLPHLESTFPLLGTPSTRGLMGASFGAVATLSTAWRRPDVFGKLLLQSGSFGFTDIGDHQRGPAFDPVVEFMNAFRADPGRPASKAFVSCGVYESLIYENRSMLPMFQSTGMDVRYVESRDGHNWENWRDRLREGLSWLFPGPLWMVYE
ncbi:MAG: alpha/beta hydrolase, partial [Planctomycetota bacterium JB042]